MIRCLSRWGCFLGLLALLTAACGGDEGPAITEGDRVAISLAVLDDVGHRAALYALDQRLVTSTTVDLVMTYLPTSALDEAARSKQYDVVETTALAAPAGAAEGFEFVILSAGLQDLDGTLLFVSADSELRSPSGLTKKTIGVVSRNNPSTLGMRYLLQRGHRIDAGLEGGEVTIEEAPAESLPRLLDSGDVDAAVLSELAAFRLEKQDDVRLLSRVTEELRDLIGAPLLSSVLVTYPDVAAQKAEALVELNRLLAESVTYLEANEDAVLEAVASEQQADPEYLRWWSERYDLPLGDLSEETQERLLQVWEAARTLGDIESYPDLADVLFNPEATTPSD